MRGINFLAGLGTIFIFIGIFCFKALFPKKLYREDKEIVNNTNVKKSGKVLLILFGCFSVVLGLFLILKAFKNVG